MKYTVYRYDPSKKPRYQCSVEDWVEAGSPESACIEVANRKNLPLTELTALEGWENAV